jgi:hypothetical protein
MSLPEMFARNARLLRRYATKEGVRERKVSGKDKGRDPESYPCLAP